MQRNGLRRLRLPQERELLDGLLAGYFEPLGSDGEGRALASDTIAVLLEVVENLVRK